MTYEELFSGGSGDGILRAVGDGRGDWRCGFHGGDFFLLFFLLGDAQLFLHLHAELVGGAAEFAHQLAELAREFGQLLRAEEEQGEEEDEGAVLKLGISRPMIRLT